MKFTLVTACIILLAAWLPAQTITGSITGTVTDSASLPVQGATVLLTQTATGAQREIETDIRASFLFTALPPGEYTLAVRHQGFKTVERSGIVLTASERLSVGDIALELGEVAERLTITAEGATVQTASAERAGVITAAQVDSMPIKGRNITSLVQLLPGVVLLSDSDLLSRTFSFSVQGNNNQFNQVSLDGVPISQQDVQTPTVSQDAIAEVKVLLTNYQAEYGRLSGANVQLVSKSGSKDFHGSAAYYKRHEQWNANNFFNNRLGRGLPVYRYNTWNYTVGGPVFIPGKFNRNRDKLFFFWSQEIPARGKAWDLALNGWQMSGIASFISGRPTGVGWSTTTAVDVTGTPSDGARIVVTGDPVLPKGERTFLTNFRTDVFRAPAVGTIGNSARTLLRQPGANNWDITAAKNLPVTERLRIQLRCELYNAFNHTQFSSFDAGARFDPQGRQVNTNFGAFTAASAARLVQLAARLSF